MREGSCALIASDPVAGTATVSWTLPDRMGSHNLAFAVGDHDWFSSDEIWVDVGADQQPG